MFSKKSFLVGAVALVVAACGAPLPTSSEIAPTTEVVPVGQVGKLLNINTESLLGPGLNGLLNRITCPLIGGSNIGVNVGPNGGTISLGGVSLTIPSGALTRNTLIVMVPIPGNRPMVKFLPEGLIFKQDRRPTLTMSTECIGNPRNAKIVFTDEAGRVLENLGGTSNGHSVSAPLGHFSRYAVDW